MRHILRACSLLILMALSSVLAFSQPQGVSFSKHGGFYDDSFTLSLQCPSECHIHYTLDGSEPTAASPCYEEPLFLDEHLFSPSNIHTIVDCIPSIFYPVDDVKRAIVIRAAAFDDNDSCVSEVHTNTYCIKSLGCDLHGLPVLSIATDSVGLFDYYTGIFVPGVFYDPSDSTHTGNYFNTGREWERACNVEFYEPTNIGINQQCGLRTHGAASRFHQQKGMRLYAREDYGKKRFVHRFFDNSTHASFKHLNLKPFRCSNWLQTGAQDYLAHRIAHNLRLDALAVREVVVLLNGEYWGIYTLEESPDERYLEDNFDVDIDSCNMVKYWGVAECGSAYDWWTVLNWMGTADLADSAQAAFAYQRIDVPSFLDYELFEIYSANLDWPANNSMLWQPADGKPFRFLFYDGDGCFTNLNFDAMGNATDSLELFPTANYYSTIVFRRFLGCPEFRTSFYNRFMELQNSHFSYDAMHAYWQHYGNTVIDEISDQSDRFHFPTSYNRWVLDMAQCDIFLQQRNALMEQQLSSFVATDEVPAAQWDCYPNPFGETFSLELPDPCGSLLQIFDVAGRECFRQVLTDGGTSIRITPDIPSGIYLLKVGSVTQIIVKE